MDGRKKGERKQETRKVIRYRKKQNLEHHLIKIWMAWKKRERERMRNRRPG